LPPGTALAIVIIATDKTQLTQFSNSKPAYPAYLTLGKTPRAISCKPVTANEKSSRTQCLFHESMCCILDVLKLTGVEGMYIIGGDGAMLRVYPVLACYIVDYPEKYFVTCAK
ncbi:hypothetical protein SERLA73DRAFT_38049, partial [Serpula lacrymans var. lacrymans S7.3]